MQIAAKAGMTPLNASLPMGLQAGGLQAGAAGTARFSESLRTSMAKVKGKAIEPANEKEAELKKVCEDFESVFINYLFEKMRTAGPKSEFMGKGIDHEIFTSMQDQEFSKGMAKAGGLGLSRVLFEQMKKRL